MAGPCCCDTLFCFESRVIRIRMAQELDTIDQIVQYTVPRKFALLLAVKGPRVMEMVSSPRRTIGSTPGGLAFAILLSPWMGTCLFYFSFLIPHIPPFHLFFTSFHNIRLGSREFVVHFLHFNRPPACLPMRPDGGHRGFFSFSNFFFLSRWRWRDDCDGDVCSCPRLPASFYV